MQKAWWKEAVIYQIYPRSFADSNGDGIGDLNGIIAHLDYLQTLGIDVIWLSPVYKSPNDDNGYDISDYRNIMDDFGTMEDFDRLLLEAHRHNIKIVMDLVVNHTSDEHAWFVESRSSKENPYRDYYIWKEAKDGKEPNNWGSWFGGSAWEKDERTGMYYLHCFSKKQPDLNWENPKVRDEVFDMMNWWCEKGIDGFRMDVISMISKVQSFPDGPVEDGLYGSLAPYVCNGPRVHEYLKEMNKRVLSHYDLLTVGEASGVTIDEAKKYANNDGSELGMIFQFEHVNLVSGPIGKWTDQKPQLKDFRRVMNQWQYELEGKAWNSLYLDNHDQPRAVSRFGNDSKEYRVVSAKMLATCLHMMKGTPYIYQGEEIGMTNDYLEKIEDYEDIESLTSYYQRTEGMGEDPEYMFKCVQKKSRDNARTAMQWDDSEYAGFGDAGCWFTINPNYKTINVKNQMNDAESIYSYYKKLIQLRKNYPIIVYGDFHPLYEESEKNYCYIRELGKEKLLVLCSFSEEEQLVELPDEFFGRKGITLISNYDKLIDLNNCIEDEKTVLLKAYEARVIYYN